MVNGRGEGLSKAFRKVASLYAEFPPNRDLPVQISSLGWIPDLVFIQIQDDKIRSGRDIYDTCTLLGPSMDRLREKGAFVVNWTGDKRHETPQWMTKFAVHCDVTCFSNMEDVNRLRDLWKLNAEFLQIGIDPEVFNNSYPKIDAPEIVFMGNNHGRYPLSNLRHEIVQFLGSKYGSRFGVYGNGYNYSRGNFNADGGNPFPMQSKESQIYNSAKIAISISHFDSERYISDRLLRIMGSNCFALSHHYKGIEEDFTPGVHLETFKTREELKEKIDYYLAHEEERNRIKDAGYELIHSRHTYDNMVQDIINLRYE